MATSTHLEGPDLGSDGIPVDEIATGTPTIGHFDGKPVVLVATDAGPCAVGGSCSHYGGPLGKGLSADGRIHCPWHHAVFDVETGEAVGAPALAPIPVYETAERDGRLYVTARRERTVPSPAPPSSPASVVIVGAGAAGAAAAEALRRHGYTGPVTMVGDEAPVDRPNLSKDYLAGTAPEEWMPLRSPAFYADNGIDLVSDVIVSAVDISGRVVHISDGRRLPYDALLLATGAEPRRLPVPGAELPHVHYLRTLADSRAIIDAAERAGRAVVVGAGFIGLEVAASLRHRGMEVAVVAPEEVPLAAIVGDTLGRFVTDLHRSHGVVFHLGRGVESIGPASVELDDGSSLPAELVVIGVGVHPRADLAEAAGITVDDGIVVDELLRTSEPDVFAAGDVARFPDPDGEPVRVEHWVLAERHGQAAARNILGLDEPFAEPPFFWSQHYDYRINVTGHLRGWDRETVRGDPASGDALVALSRDGLIRAVATVRRDRDSLLAEQALASGDQATLRRLLTG
jgi:NADPH-dependent 2,4-dienoyl-CoA reductase/sulfur reductase-like enzyme/nitrite reductase/ring-hydroxylating ferredoxin subunit